VADPLFGMRGSKLATGIALQKTMGKIVSDGYWPSITAGRGTATSRCPFYTPMGVSTKKQGFNGSSAKVTKGRVNDLLMSTGAKGPFSVLEKDGNKNRGSRALPFLLIVTTKAGLIRKVVRFDADG